MQQLARAMGIVSLVSGVMLLAFPDTTRRIMKAREEYSRLSPAALRILGGWELMAGLLLVAATVEPAMEARRAEISTPEFRKAA